MILMARSCQIEELASKSFGWCKHCRQLSGSYREALKSSPFAASAQHCHRTETIMVRESVGEYP
jgi:hypothetical protein